MTRARPHDASPRVGIVVHPSRDVSGPLGELREWVQRRDASLVQLSVAGQQRTFAPEGDPEECELIVSIGGDGTMLAALRAGMAGDRPVLGVACGSLGVLTRIAPGGVGAALDRFSAGDWEAQELPALVIAGAGERERLAINDLAVVRAGIGQIRVAVHADGMLVGRLAGDGVIVATPVGSSAYSLAAGGPLFGPGADGMLLTPLPAHGGALPPVVLGPDVSLALDVGQGYGGARLEVDGQSMTGAPERLGITLRSAVATTVAFADQDPLLAVLRRRGIVRDSPRILVDDARTTSEQ
jgi:NAD+ kinase